MKKVKHYYQAAGLSRCAGKYLKGKKTYIIIGTFQTEKFIQKITNSLETEYECCVYDDDCSYEKIQALAIKLQEEKFDSIIGFGGGKILDVAKAITYFYPCFLMVVPTSASMDGVCSALSVLYHEDGTMDRYLYLEHNPDVVLVDTQLIFEAPTRLFVAGMGDALSTYFETFAYQQKHHTVKKEVLDVSKRCFETLMKFGVQAKTDMEKNCHSEAIDTIIHCNIYDSGFGFENSGLSVAHAFNNALANIGYKDLMHGESVAIGLLVQLALQKDVHYQRVETFMREVGLPMRINIKKVDDLLTNLLKEEGLNNHPQTFSKKEITEVVKTYISN